MGPPAKVASRTSDFPFVGVGLFVLILQTVLVAMLPPNPYRSAVTIAALFATGYCALALVVGRSVRMSAAEILAFSAGLTILITALSAVAVSVIGIPITDLAITIIGLPIAAAAWILHGPHAGPWKAFRRGLHGLFDFSDYSRSEKIVAGALLTGIAIALAAFILLSGLLTPDQLTPGLAIVGPDGTPGSLPTTFTLGQPEPIVLSALGGSRGGTFEVRIRLVPVNATGNETFHAVSLGPPLQMDPFAEYATNITLARGEEWTQPLSVSIQATGSFDLRFDLIDATSAVVASNILPVVVT